MAITGSWKTSPAATDGEDQRNHSPRDNWGDGVDPRHNVAPDHNTWSDVGFPGPVVPPFHQEVPIQIEDSYNITYIPPTMPAQTDEPNNHDGVATAPWGVGDWRAQQANNAARSVDHGMPRMFQTRETVMRGVTQSYDFGRGQSLPASTSDTQQGGQAGRAIRGKNSLKANNPGDPTVNGSGNYTRQGWDLHHWTNRWMPRKTMTHTRRMLHLNLAATAKPAAAATGASYSPYVSPFDGRVTQGLNQGVMSPMARREPEVYNESAITDGTADVTTTPGFMTWGL